MASTADIYAKVKEYLAPDPYDIRKIDYIPDIKDTNITYGNKGVKIDATVLYLDMRNSTEVIKKHHKYTVSKLQKAYLYIAAQIVNDNGGHVRSFNGDGILAFFPNNDKTTIRSAVKAAMSIKYMLTTKCKAEFERYHALDYGIGIDHGELFVTRVGTPRNTNNNDLTWIGLPVNTAVRLGDAAKNPNNIRISQGVFDNLPDDVRYFRRKINLLLYKPMIRTHIWQQATMKVHSSDVDVYETACPNDMP